MKIQTCPVVVGTVNTLAWLMTLGGTVAVFIEILLGWAFCWARFVFVLFNKLRIAALFCLFVVCAVGLSAAAAAAFAKLHNSHHSFKNNCKKIAFTLYTQHKWFPLTEQKRKNNNWITCSLLFELLSRIHQRSNKIIDLSISRVLFERRVAWHLTTISISNVILRTGLQLSLLK